MINSAFFDELEKLAGDPDAAYQQTRHSNLIAKHYGMPEGDVYRKLDPPDHELNYLWHVAGSKDSYSNAKKQMSKGSFSFPAPPAPKPIKKGLFSRLLG